MKHKVLLFLALSSLMALSSCRKETPVNSSNEGQEEKAVTLLDKADVRDYDKFVQPSEFSFNFLDCNSKWSFWRSKQSEHFILFWAKEYGKYGLYGDKAGEALSSPSTDAKDSPYYVDIDDLLAKAEAFYRFHVDELGFLEPGSGKSCVDKYKIQIYLNHDTEWLATGAGYDNKIGALWISPSTCKPVGSTIGHEIGHTFQYMVYCDQLLSGSPDDMSRSFRFNLGQGSGFWEQCAQWQSYMMYGKETFTGWFSEFCTNAHRHFSHEDIRYASYFLQSYWAEKHGVRILSDIWKNNRQPYDALQTYMELKGLSLDELNAELYEYAARCVSWDFGFGLHDYSAGISGETVSIRELGRNHIGSIPWKYEESPEGRYTVSADKAPEATGFNHIRLNLPENGEEVSVDFRPELDVKGYGPVGPGSSAAWTVGFVEILRDGTRVYSDPVLLSSETRVSHTPGADAEALWFVVCATPSVYMQHLWDENNGNDVHWPYSISVEGSDLYGRISFDGTETVSDAEISYSAQLSCADGYDGPLIVIEGKELLTLAKAMVMQPDAIFSSFPADREDIHGSYVKIAAVQEDGSLSYDYTAYGYGFWYDKDGNVTDWEHGYIFMEFHPETRLCRFGVHPSRVNEGAMKAGDSYSTSFAILYGEHKTVFTYEFEIVK